MKTLKRILIISVITIYGYYPADLYSYLLKNGTENMKFFDEHWAG